MALHAGLGGEVEVALAGAFDPARAFAEGVAVRPAAGAAHTCPQAIEPPIRAVAKAVRRRLRAVLPPDAAARGCHVTVEVDGGTVILKGHVASWPEREQAARAAAAAPGVVDVRNELLVDPWPFAPVMQL